MWIVVSSVLLLVNLWFVGGSVGCVRISIGRFIFCVIWSFGLVVWLLLFLFISML